MFDADDTIVAVASAAGSGLRGIVRLSGPASLKIVDQCVRFPESGTTTDKQAYVQSGFLGLDKSVGDLPVQCFKWPSTRSYTGQPVAEIHLLGAPPLVEQTVSKLVEAGARLARPGEFTLRAFLAGRLDLVQCEAVLAVIDAQEDEELKSALRQLAGGLTERLDEARSRLLDALAEIEAGLDFADEDLELIPSQRLRDELTAAMEAIRDAQQKMHGRRLSSGRAKVALVGPPNAGKSSLLNAIVGSRASIVSPMAGTTRDWVSATTSIDGLEIDWIDTAGIETEFLDPSLQEISQAAQNATQEQMREADMRIVCVDVSSTSLTSEVQSLIDRAEPDDRSVVVLTKCDRGVLSLDLMKDQYLRTSSVTGAGIERLKQEIVARLKGGSNRDRLGFVASTSQRCSASLVSAAESLSVALELVGSGADEILAAELRVALDALGEVTGRVYTDDVLDRIFSKFCIGK